MVSPCISTSNVSQSIRSRTIRERDLINELRVLIQGPKSTESRISKEDVLFQTAEIITGRNLEELFEKAENRKPATKQMKQEDRKEVLDDRRRIVSSKNKAAFVVFEDFIRQRESMLKTKPMSREVILQKMVKYMKRRNLQKGFHRSQSPSIPMIPMHLSASNNMRVQKFPICPFPSLLSNFLIAQPAAPCSYFPLASAYLKLLPFNNMSLLNNSNQEQNNFKNQSMDDKNGLHKEPEINIID